MTKEEEKEKEKEKGKAVHPMTDPKACQELKEKHDSCFYKWYNDKFLKGTITIECKEEWEEYQYCLRQKLKAWNLEHLNKEEKK